MKKKLLISLAVLMIALGVLFMFLNKTSTEIQTSRVFDAPVNVVWKHFNDPESMKQWWSPKDFTAPVIQNDPRVGGKFLLSMKAPDGSLSYNSGTYTEVVENQKLVSQMGFSDENGNVAPSSKYGIPGDWPEFVTVMVEFKDVGGKTEVKITETGIPRIMSLFAKMGWEQQFDKFELLLKSQ